MATVAPANSSRSRTNVRGLALALALALPPIAGSARPAAAQDAAGCEHGEPEVRAVRFEGNRAFSDAQLSAAVYVTASGFGRRYLRVIGAQRCLDRERFPLDRAALIVYYRRKGYPDVAVDTAVRDLGGNRVDITFRIREGRPMVVDTLFVQGLDSVRDSTRVVRNLPLRVGHPYDVYAEAATLDTLRRRLHDNGYPDADVLRESRTHRETYSAAVTPQALPGVYARVGEIRIESTPLSGGRRHASDDAIRRVMGLRPGRPYSERELIEARRRLFQTDLFRQVEVRPDTGRRPGDSLVNVSARLLEGDVYSARVGVGYATLDCFRTSGAVTARNLRYGRVDLTGRLSKIGIGHPLDWSRALCRGAANDPFSDTLNYYLGATLTRAAIPGLRALTFTVFSERRSEYRAYLRTVPIGTVVSFDLNRFRPLLATAAYDLTYGQTTAEQALFCAVFLVCDPADQAELQQRKVQAAVGLTLTRRHVDNELEPRRGSVTRVSVRSAHRWVGSDTSLQFNRLQGELAWYTPHGRNVLAARVQLGTVLGRTFSLRGENVPKFIPPAERLFAGGANTVRGYRQNLLGPLVYVANAVEVGDTLVTAEGDTSFVYQANTAASVGERPTGGNTLVVGNLEYRLRSPFLSQYLQWVIFGDVGQVWNRQPGGEDVNLDFSIFRFTPGGGFRVATPIGAIRVDVGYNTYDRPIGAVYYSEVQHLRPVGDPTGPEVTIPSFFCVTPPAQSSQVVDRVAQSQEVINGRVYRVRRQDTANCLAAYTPGAKTGIRALTLHLSIGQAF
ncbi:MAG TPA: BamA/TamA family outer membrane protein [Gemmatimonadaceae bacterium]|nr:BamA/TamA family outer membrane protein [Gemmatimonadaceae bacterium]